MSRITATIRRGLVLALIGAAARALWTQLSKPKSPDAPTQSPPLGTEINRSPTPPNTSPSPHSVAATETDDSLPDVLPQPWVLPNDDGSTPDTHPIKVNGRSGIFHLPGGRFYSRTTPERCYATPEEAEADGYRQAKN